MRSAAIFLILVTAVYASDCSNDTHCHEDSCMPKYKCELPVMGAKCHNSEHICCSVVKDEYRTACRHWGGECMSWCAEIVRRPAKPPCPKDTMCCVLV